MITQIRRIKNRKYSADWRRNNPKKRKEVMERYYLKNRDKILDYCRKKYIKNKEKIDARVKEYSKSEIGKEAKRKYRKSNKQRFRAYNLLNKAVSRGNIFKSPCAECGHNKVEAHHADYSKPLDVLWLCRKHHRELHKNI